MESSPRCDICNIDVLRASLAEHLISTKHKENVIERDEIVPSLMNPMNPTKANEKHITLKL